MRTLLVGLLILSLTHDALADCSGGATSTGKACGAIDFAGCCKEGVLYFCEAGELCALECLKIPMCGWNSDKGYYDCDTAGMADPDLLYPLECPSMAGGECQGVDYAGCCAGSTVYWCDGKQLHGYDCGDNESKSMCGTNAAVSVADCVEPGSAEFKSCPFEPDEVALPDVVTADVIGGDTQGTVDVQLSTDGLSVPDIAAPSSCTTLEERYQATGGDCEFLGGTVLTLQDGCAALLVGMAPDAVAHPSAKVTKTGLAFWFATGGLEYNCTGSFADGGMSGQCFWGNGGECTFSYATATVIEPEEEPKKGKGGCHSGPVSTPVAAGLLLALGLLVGGLRRRV